MKIKFKRFNENAAIPYKTHADDYCYDLVATSCEEIAPNVYKYGTGIALQVDEKTKARALVRDSAVFGFDVRPRSSVWKTGMVLSNCIGTIDQGYTGEISAVFYHVLPDMPRYQVGDRIAQLCMIQTAHDIEFEEVDDFATTDRGTGGYGSTGK